MPDAWAIAEDLSALGCDADADVPELNDADAMAEFMQQYVGKAVNVKVTQRPSKDGSKVFNNFKFKGLADGASMV